MSKSLAVRRNNEAILKEGIIDADVHPRIKEGMKSLKPYMSRTWQEYFGETGLIGPPLVPVAGTGGNRLDAVPPGGGVPGSDPYFIKEDHLDKYNVKYALMSFLQAGPISAMGNPKAANVIASVTNDYAINEFYSVDSRLRLAMIVSPLDPIGAAKEIERLGNEKAVAAVMVTLTNANMGKAQYHPIYEAAVKYDLPIFLHPTGSEGSFVNSYQMGGGVPSTYIERHTRFVEVAYANLSSMVLEGVFERYPDLKVVITEFGVSWLPNLLWRLDQNWRIFRKEVPWLKKAPSEYILKNCWFTTQPLEEPNEDKYLDQIFEMIHAEDTLIFSSDYPHWDSDDPLITLSHLPEEKKKKIYYSNGYEVFRFE